MTAKNEKSYLQRIFDFRTSKKWEIISARIKNSELKQLHKTIGHYVYRDPTIYVSKLTLDFWHKKTSVASAFGSLPYLFQKDYDLTKVAIAIP